MHTCQNCMNSLLCLQIRGKSGQPRRPSGSPIIIRADLHAVKSRHSGKISEIDRINVDRRYHMTAPDYGTPFNVDSEECPNEDPIEIVKRIINTTKSGDIIFTGTPEGVGPLVSGDQVEMGFISHAPKNLVVI